jgi:putative membrane-bound dehydrogenase-like protein
MHFRSILGMILIAAPSFADAPILKVPEGYEIIAVAKSPLIERPVVASFDDQGRLFVAESSGSNDPPVKQLETKPHRIVCLEDTDGDGIFDKRTVFAEGLSFLQGVMCYRGSVYVGAPPKIWKLTDTDSDGKADQRETWFDGKTLTGCANDLHGPYLGPDGWIYWTKGAFALQEHQLANGKKLKTRASHIFRARPDGTGLDVIMTGGMDNPVDVTFTAEGEAICSNTFLQHPGDGKRDGLIHAVYGSIFGKDHDVVSLTEHPRTAPGFMPIMTHLGPAAPSGLHRLESAQLDKDFRDNLFCAQFNMRKISRHQMVRDGSTFKTIDADFVTSENLDFHPTDVLEDGDGSLIVIDTGGWYKLCCPTSQLVKPDILGGIYRVRKKGNTTVADPFGKQIPWKTLKPTELLEKLVDARTEVRKKAIEAFGSHKDLKILIDAIKQESPESLKVAALWALHRADSKAGLLAALDTLGSTSLALQRVALHLITLERPTINEAARLQLIAATQSRDWFVRRKALEAIGRWNIKSLDAVASYTLQNPNLDRFLQHAATYALIENQLVVPSGDSGIPPRARSSALMAWNHATQKKGVFSAVAAHLDSSDVELRETAWWITRQHPEWGASLAKRFEQQLQQPIPGEKLEEFINTVSQFASSPEVQAILARGIENDASRSITFAILSRVNLKVVPTVWYEAIEKVLPKSNTDQAIAILKAIRLLGQGKPLPEPLQKMIVAVYASNEFQMSKLRLTAMQTLGSAFQPNSQDWNLLQKEFNKQLPTHQRAILIDVFATAKLHESQMIELIGKLDLFDPRERTRLLDRMTQSTQASIGLVWIKALSSPKILPSVRKEDLQAKLAKYPEEVKLAAQPLYQQIDQMRAGQNEKMESILAQIKNGDIRRGQLVFASQKGACINCHQMGYKGGKVGPDLTRIGNIRGERDLLEALIYPSSSFVRSYEPFQVTTVKGQAFNGILKKDAPDEVILVLDAEREVRIPRSDIEEMQPGTTSVMPAGFDQQLSVQEIIDVVTFLKASK